MKQIAVVVLNYNGKNYLSRFLPGLILNSPQADIIIADNASTDDSVTFLRENYPEIKLILLKENFGFTGGYNRAIVEIPNKWVILLNSDVEVTPDWITPLESYLEQHPNCAAIQPKILSYSDRNTFDYAGASGGFIDSLGYPFCRGRIFDTVEQDAGQYNDVREIAWATGAAMLVRKKLFLDIGGFDENFFAHMEEIDLCWRLRRSGFSIVVQPASTIYHVGGGTLDRTSPMKTCLNFRNSLWVLLKNLDSRKIIPYLFLRLSLDGVAGIKFILEGKFKHSWAIISAHFQFYAKILSYRKIRKSESEKIELLRIGLDNMNGTYSGSIVWAYYLKRIQKFKSLDL